MMDILDILWCKVYWWSRRIIETLVPSNNSINFSLYSIQEKQRPCNLPNHIVQSRAQPATSNNCCIHGLRIEMEFFPRPRPYISAKCKRRHTRLDTNVAQYALMVSNEFAVFGSVGELFVSFFITEDFGGCASVVEGCHDVLDAFAFRWEVFVEFFEFPEVYAIKLDIAQFHTARKTLFVLLPGLFSLCRLILQVLFRPLLDNLLFVLDASDDIGDCCGGSCRRCGNAKSFGVHSRVGDALERGSFYDAIFFC
mmetsp:Transcript_13025/g.27589  ORF Transcript_13025/g.27589 Transcript_13025/m.27589 type:complete len:253 (-) Transcript_13025:22-780(-)